MTTGQFQEWQRITDFSLLKVWSIGCVEDSALLRSIVDIHPFQHLAQLTLALIESKGDENLEFRRAAEEMFKSLPPLTYLWLLGSYTPAFLNHGVLVKHGPTLLELKLYKRPERMPVRHDMRRLWRKLGRKRTAPVFSSDDISELAGRCPSLQKLRLCAQRPQGLGTDVWNAFGRFRHLEELDLTLKCSPEMDTNMMPVPLRELSEFEKGVVECSFTCRRWFIRDCIINSSINESLAKAFFTHIRTCQEVKRFANLVIRPLCTPAPGDHFWNHLALTWIIKVDPLTGLHAKSSKPSKTSVPTPETSFEAEMLSIVQSI
ncbi:uncharacterized protein N7483_002223 [Penicillium malachiteum]|uniref:uncharacterized protein n=1 Tax=Penicillium malachiteum TaxID=1324776 RepID=UPI0025483562|nr:uncharacterized protein N7483_002223 [Penicillium malachiteum]KAJ5737098.1 hypothetical protein N7483_002223 [Penicillium malachiteum]